MRKSALFLLAMIAAPLPVSAQPYDNYPVCIKVYGPVTYLECTYASIAQCNAAASGRSAQCLMNPFFSAATQEPRKARVHRRRHGD